MTVEHELSPNHWRLDQFVQRMPASAWKKVLLMGRDEIVFKGCVVKLKAKNIGFGVVEISKEAKI